MSEKTEKLVHIIMPDLLNYLEMVENGKITKKRIEKNITITHEGEKNKIIMTEGYDEDKK